MNRRNFFKFLGKGAAALGVVATTGLPDVDKAQEEVEWKFNIPKYNSDAEIVIPELADFWPVASNPEDNEFPRLDKIIRTGFDDDTIYAGGQFTAMPNGLDYDGLAIYNGTFWESLDDWSSRNNND